jgi:VIT1/CCC1 family predicted Fe2+/Mn2+ transporter
VPLIPYLFWRGPHALAAAIGLSAFALFLVGAATSLFTGRSATAGGLRMLAIGAAAGAVTYAIGAALGVSLG